MQRRLNRTRSSLGTETGMDAPRPPANDAGALDRQTDYWDRVAEEKEFTHPVDADRFCRLVPASAAILDLGCGYGRTWADLRGLGYEHIIGVDISRKMIEQGHRLHPEADLRLWDGIELPFPAAAFDAALLFAVLTCVPSDDGQRTLVSEVARGLRPGGVLYVSDYPLQQDVRNRERYARFEGVYDTFGVFRLAEGVVVRHHSMEWIDDLLSSFRQVDLHMIDVPTMNGNISRVFQYFGRKRQTDRPAASGTA